MARSGSWKNEFDRKYNRLMNMRSISCANKTNEVLLKAIAGLDKILAEIERRGSAYNLPKRLGRG